MTDDTPLAGKVALVAGAARRRRRGLSVAHAVLSRWTCVARPERTDRAIGMVQVKD